MDSLKAKAKELSSLVFMRDWLIRVIIYGFFSLMLLPLKPSLFIDLMTFNFVWQAVFLFISAASFSFVTYLSVVKFPLQSKIIKIYFLPLGIGLGVFFFQGDWNNFNDHLIIEMNIWRGICTGLMVMFGCIETIFLILWIKKHQPSKLLDSLVYVTLSSSITGAFLIQFICLYDSAHHSIVWHFFPVLISCFISSKIGNKFLNKA